MSDQMPDEALIDRRMHAWRPEDWHVLDRREGQVLYTRVYEQAGEFDHQGIDPADLGQHFADAMQALTARNAVSKAACAQLIAEQAQRAERAEAERDEWMSRFAALEANWLKVTEQCEQAEAERDALRQQAEGWAQEARTQRATVHECYQACTGATGEPGDWHGAEPVRAVVAERDRLRAALERLMRGEGGVNSLEQERIAQEALDHGLPDDARALIEAALEAER